MLRKLMMFAMFAMATPVFVQADAHAATKEELKAQKEDVKEAKSTAKTVSKIAKKWPKLNDKGKDTKALEQELRPILRSEIKWLADQGVTGPEPMVHPSETKGRMYRDPAEEAQPRPRLEELREIVVTLRDGDVRPARYSNLLNEYAERLNQRYERKKNNFKRAKKAS